MIRRLVKKMTPQFVLGLYYAAWALAGVLVYTHPSRSIKVVGITGTNGKTSTTHIVSNMLEAKGMKVGSISSLRFKIGDREWTNDFKMTMPGRLHIQKFIRECVDAGCDVVVMEVTSEGVSQKRHLGIRFDTAAFTNLTPEHIESHGSFEKYKQAKGAFFAKKHRVSVVNMNDEAAPYFLEFLAQEKIGYSSDAAQQRVRVGVDALLEARTVEVGPTGISFNVDGVSFAAPLLGHFNVDNSLAAIGICVAQGMTLDEAAAAFAAVRPVPGRAEVVLHEPFGVVVDYAHTPDGLEKVYAMVKSVRDDSARQICVLGAAGSGRDKWKRPQLGSIADAQCDEIILTDEDPYDEDPMAILEQVQGGVADSRKVRIVLDRRAAISLALKSAKPKDIVVITGKGAEPLMMKAHGRRVPWDDREVVKEEFSKLYG